MMRKIGIVLITLLLCGSSYAQNIHFLKSYGNTGYDYGRDIEQTADTGYIATGSSSSFGSADSDAFLLKVDSLGNFKWSYNYGGTGSDWGQALAITYDSSYAVGGFTNSFGEGGFDVYLVRADINGFPLWEKTYGGEDWDKALDIAEVVQDSGFVLVGETQSYGAGGRDVYIIRTNKNGDTLWTKTYGGTGDDYASSVIVDGDSIVICGGTESYGAGMFDGLIIKMGIDGNIGWTKAIGQEYDDYFTSIIKSSTFYCLGGSRSYNYLSSFNDFWVYKTQTNGTEIVDTTWGGDQFGHDVIYDVVVEQPLNVIYYGGTTTSWGSADVVDGITDCFINKFDFGYGWMLYLQNFGDLGTDAVYAMDFCLDNGLVAIGDMSKYSTGGNNVMILRVDYNNSFGFITVFDEVAFEDITLDTEEIFESETYISIFPNPSSGYLNLTNSENVEAINVYDATGNMITTISKPGPEIEIEWLKSGIYFFEFTSNESREMIQVIRI